MNRNKRNNHAGGSLLARFILVCNVLAVSLCASGASRQFASPDGSVSVEVDDRDGRPTYQVSLGGTTLIGRSPLGLKANFDDLTQGLTLKDCEVSTFSDEYWLSTWKQRHVKYTATQAVCHFEKSGRPALDVIFRVTGRDVAFRYKVYARRGRGGETLAAVIESEATGFVLPSGTTTFLCPQMKPMTGFARTAPSYETGYTPDDQPGKNGWGEGYTFPCLFRVRSEELGVKSEELGVKSEELGVRSLRRAATPNSSLLTPNSYWVLISESGTDGGYVGCRLLCEQNDAASTPNSKLLTPNSYRIGFPMAAEMNGQGTTTAAVSLPCLTPWRTITLGTSLKPIVETTIANDLVQPKYKPSRVYDYGKGSWSWIIGMDASCNFDEQKRYIDFSAAMGWRSVLVDALWDTQIGYERMAELSRYARSRGVGLFLWYNSNGSWNDAPQGPRHKLDKSSARRKEMAWMQQNGILGIKVDFFGGDKQPMMQLYEDILTDANDFGLQVIFHGCTLPRGWERMYPNFVAAEAVLASENLHFGQGACDAEAFNACLHPFLRNTVASMDFGGSALNKHYSKDNEHGTTRRTSDVFALATAVLFQSSVQHFALAPNNLHDAPGWAVEFMKDVPTQWDETRFIDGYPGRYVIMARRSGDQWYIAGINAQETPVKTKLDLSPFFRKGTKVTAYTDDARLNGKASASVLRSMTADVIIPRNGGVVLVGEVGEVGEVGDVGDVGNTVSFENPMLFADVPDHDIIRVGDAYYMVSTTMHFAPGCGIMKSHDLVHWEIVNYAYDALDEGDNFRLLNGKSEYSQGQWATNLRYDPYEKLYYMIMTCNTTGKTYFYVTDDIENGRWHCSTTDKCYDPGLLFDDTGTEVRKYVLHPADTFDDHAMYLREMKVDEQWNVTVSEPRKVIDYANLENPARGLRAEGYHGYKIGRYYYIFMIQGCDGQRQEIVWRTDDLFRGQWEGRLVFGGEMTDEQGQVVMRTNGIGQGGIVQTADGQWWCFLFKDYGSLGRMPVLLPMTWSADGWPVVGNGTTDQLPKGRNMTTPYRIDIPITVQGNLKSSHPSPLASEGIVQSDEFDFWKRPRSKGRFGSHPQDGLRLVWQWNHVPDAQGWSLTDRRGWLRLKPTAVVKNIREARNTLTQRSFGPVCTGDVLLDVAGLADGDVAGLSAFQNRYGFVGVKREGAQRFLVMQRATAKDDAQGKEIERIPLDSHSQVYLRVRMDFRNLTDKAIFYYSLDGEHWTPIGDTLQMHYDWPDFCGYRFALFHYATKATGGHADFDFFHCK